MRFNREKPVVASIDGLVLAGQVYNAGDAIPAGLSPMTVGFLFRTGKVRHPEIITGLVETREDVPGAEGATPQAESNEDIESDGLDLESAPLSALFAADPADPDDAPKKRRPRKA